MSDEEYMGPMFRDMREPPDGREPCAVPIEEQCVATLAHYERLATVANEWNNQVPQAIRAWYASLQNAAPQVAESATNGGPRAGLSSPAVAAPSDTPRTDAILREIDHLLFREGTPPSLREFARQLEREISAICAASDRLAVELATAYDEVARLTAILECEP